MTKRSLFFLALSVPVLSLAEGAPTPVAAPAAVQGAAPVAAPRFDLSTVVTVTGTVMGEKRVDRGTEHEGVVLLLRTSVGEMPVHLGPGFWVDTQALKVSRGDQVTVRGSLVPVDGKPALVAETVTWGSAVLVLRSPAGAPVWPAQRGPKPPGTWPGMAQAFDPATVVTVTGVVAGTTRVDRGMDHKGVLVQLTTADGEITVHLGPDFWVDKQALRFGKGDRVTVRGSLVPVDGKPAIVAESVRWGDAVLVLRDGKGAPAWVRQGPN